MQEQGFRIRPHHGMCMLFFGGRGYSEEFTRHMASTIAALSDDVPVTPTVGADEICRKCPNNIKGVCTADEKTARYDRRVLELCGIAEGVSMSYSQFRNAVLDNVILPGRRREVCADCEWTELCGEAEEALHSR